MSTLIQHRTILESPLALVAALMRAEYILGLPTRWTATTPEQLLFLEETSPHREKPFDIEGLTTMVSFSNDALSHFLDDNGFDPSSSDLPETYTFGTASLLQVLPVWAGPHSPIEMETTSEDIYAAILFCGDGITYFQVPDQCTPLAQIPLTNGNMAFIMEITTEEMTNDFSLTTLAQHFSHERIPHDNLGDLIMPAVVSAQEVDLDWMTGLHADSPGRGMSILGQARQQNCLCLSSSTEPESQAQEPSLRPPPRPISTIASSFLFWIERPELPFPLITAVVNRESWLHIE